MEHPSRDVQASAQDAVGAIGLMHTAAAFGSLQQALEVRSEIATAHPELAAHALRLFDADRGRIFRYWRSLTQDERRALLLQVAGLDLDLMERNLRAIADPDLLASRTAGTLEPPEILEPNYDARHQQALELGEEVLRQGWLAVVEGAGGTGSRFFKAAGDLPKGLFPISATHRYSFFEVRLDHLKALRRRYGRPIPYIVMVSDATELNTRNYFEEHDFFGMRDEIHIVRQRSLAYLEHLEDGHYDLVLESPSRVAVGGYGHADFTKYVLVKPEVLAFLEGFGTRYVQWLQIDNPLATIGHRHLLGAHRAAEASLNPKALAMSFIALKKAVATEKAGVLVRRGGGIAVWEYSDMDACSQHLLLNRQKEPRLAVRRGDSIQLIAPDELGQGDELLGLPDLPDALRSELSYCWGAINPNLVVVSLESVIAHPADNPPLLAMKPCRHLGPDGQLGDMKKKFVKFEAFLFDGLNDGVVVAEARGECFAPTKNAEGEVDSPASARALLNEHGALRLRELDWQVDLEGGTIVELTGLSELRGDALASRVGRKGRIDAGGVLSVHGLEVEIGDGLHITSSGALLICADVGTRSDPLTYPAAIRLPARTVVRTTVELLAGAEGASG